MANKNDSLNKNGSSIASEKRHYDQLALKYKKNWWGNRTKAGQRRQEIRADLAFEFCDLKTKSRVLEIGCSDGQFTKALLSRAEGKLQIVGVDISFQLLRLARQNILSNGVDFFLTDVGSMAFKKESFDAVVGNAILHHLHLRIVVPEILRILKPGGYFFFAEPNMVNPQVFLEKKVKFLGHFLQNTPDETAFVRGKLRHSLESLGVDIHFIEPFDFLHPITPWFMIPWVEWISKKMENMPLLREVAGSLLIVGKKPS